MGYKLTSLAALPVNPETRMYVFVIGDGLWPGALEEMVERHFDRIAKAIGRDTVIVNALTDEMHGEVVEAYLGKRHKELKNRLPGLLLTDAHPDALTEESFRLVVPFRKAEERYDALNDFLADLTALVRGDDDSLVRALEDAPIPEKVTDLVEVSFPLAPGIGVNVKGVAR